MLNTSGTIMHTMGSVIISTLLLVLSSYRIVQNVDRQILAILMSVYHLIQTSIHYNVMEQLLNYQFTFQMYE